MPDISKHLEVLEGFKNGSYPTLGLSLGSRQVTPGEKIPRADTKATPTLLAPPDLPQGSYAIISIDLDVPFASFNILSPGAHWVQTGFKITDQPNRELKSDDPAVAYWAAAAPPPGAAPHRYVFFLYKQMPDSSIPQNYKEKPFGNSQRVRFDVDGMVKQLKLGEIVAVNYFVSN
ncbi:hypothetical protein UA08_06861 [Talaromyces atroroseus]|uniref:PEBP-like protein n=1 Tax=Talaromyces atroroseus TaxID=1441469 RepID=A0A225AL63_TALAT|nr:hypothetical protein UA08_06861 [Talaromyces atroroseus]OKL57988.1 hypothetical protein UA08_06861 [Talaromyces atroroseus]